MGAGLHRAAQRQRAVQEGRRRPQRPGQDRERLRAPRIRLDRPERPARPDALVGPLHPAQARASTAVARRPSSRTSSTTSTSCFASAATADCSSPAQLRAIADVSQTYARDTADITDRQNIQLHWVRIEDVPAIWQRLEAVGLTTNEACGDTPRVVLGSPVAGVAADEIIDGTPAIEEIVASLRRRPAVLQPAAQVQVRRLRLAAPGRRARGERRLVHRRRAPRARTRVRRLRRRRPVDQPHARAAPRRVGAARRGARRLGVDRRGLPRLRAIAGCARVRG